ncbi:MAG: ABC transporter permease [Pseudolysinimonas sp.]
MLSATPAIAAGQAPWWRRVLASNTLWIFGVLILISVVFTVMNPAAFATAYEVRSVATNASMLLVVSVGMTFVIVTGGIDLSVGSVLVFSGVIAAKTMGAGTNEGATADWPRILLGIAAGIAAGLVWGLVNGALVAFAKVPPLIATLGTLGAAYGLSLIIANGQDLRGVPDKFTGTIGLGTLGGIPWLVIIGALVTAAGALVLSQTRFGRYTTAVGSNPEAARRVGINVRGHLLKVYALQGALAGLAGVLSLAYFTTTTITGQTSLNLAAITAVVIGGTSLFGGRGSVLGSAVGVFIPSVLASGLIIVGVQSYWQNVALGLVLVAAVFIDQLRRQSRSRA